MTFHPRLSPKFSGRSSSCCMEAFAPPSRAAVLKVPESWNTRRSTTGACNEAVMGFVLLGNAGEEKRINFYAERRFCHAVRNG